MMRRVVLVLALLGAMATPLSAQALGPAFTLGYNCQLYFVPPTLRSDGVTPITGALTYSAYLTMSPSQPLTMPSAPTIANAVGTTAVGDPLAAGATWKILLCLNTNTPTGTIAIPTAGQWWVTLVANEAGIGSSVQTGPVPFALAPVQVGPAPPTNVGVR